MRCTFLALAEDISRDDTGAPTGTVNRLDVLYSGTGHVVLPTCVVWATFRGDPEESATIRIDLVAPHGATIGTTEHEDACRILAMRAPGGTSYHDGMIRLSGTREPSDVIFDLSPLALKGFGHYRVQLVLNDVIARETMIEMRPQA